MEVVRGGDGDDRCDRTGDADGGPLKLHDEGVTEREGGTKKCWKEEREWTRRRWQLKEMQSWGEGYIVARVGPGGPVEAGGNESVKRWGQKDMKEPWEMKAKRHPFNLHKVTW